MASTNFTGTQLAAASAFQGRIDVLTVATRYVFRQVGSGLALNITGTDATITGTFTGGSPSSPFDLYLNGVLQTAPTQTAGSMPLYTGLSDVSRLVELRLKAAFVGTGNFVAVSTTALTVVGAVPAIAADTTRGPQMVALSGYKVATTVLPLVGVTATQQPMTGSTQYQFSPPATSGGFQGNSIRVKGRADRVWAFVDTGNAAKFFAVAKDGVIISASRTSVTANGFLWAQIGASGLDDGSEHDWEVIAGGNANNGGQLDMIMLGGSVGAISATAPTARSCILCVGDSITASVDGGGGVGVSTQGDGTLAFPVLIGKSAGKDALAMGRSGTLWITCAQEIASDIQSALAACGGSLTHVVILYGRNDTVQATVLANATTALQQALAVPGFTGKIVVVTVPQIGAFTGVTAVGVNDGIRAAVAAVNSSRVALVEGFNWTSITALSDGTHYDIAGHALFAANVYASGAMANLPSTGGGGGGLLRRSR